MAHSNIIKHQFQPLLFKGIDQGMPDDKKLLLIVTKTGSFFPGYFVWKTRKWYWCIGSMHEEFDGSGVAGYAEFNAMDCFGGDGNA